MKKDLLKIKEYDVAVIGGGIAGIAAALSSARCGAKTLLLESSFVLGGLATAGLVTVYLPLCDGNGTLLCRGIAEELLKLSIMYGAEESVPDAWTHDCAKEERAKKRYVAQYNPNVFAILSEQLLTENGADILYGGTLSEVGLNKDGNSIESVKIVTRTETLEVKAKAFIDCTGDATLCALSGEETALSECKNVLAAWYYSVDGGKYKLVTKGSCDYVYSQGTGGLDTFSGLDPVELSDVTRAAHKTALDDFLNGGEANKEHALATIFTIPQIRMTRRLVGVDEINIENDKKRIETSVGLFGNWLKSGPAYELPAGALYGRKIKNLTVAGRCVSVVGDKTWDITRVIPVCAVTGEAAGVIAAELAETCCLNIKKVQKTLEKRDIKLHLSECYK